MRGQPQKLFRRIGGDDITECTNNDVCRALRAEISKCDSQEQRTEMIIKIGTSNLPDNLKSFLANRVDMICQPSAVEPTFAFAPRGVGPAVLAPPRPTTVSIAPPTVSITPTTVSIASPGRVMDRDTARQLQTAETTIPRQLHAAEVTINLEKKRLEQMAKECSKQSDAFTQLACKANVDAALAGLPMTMIETRRAVFAGLAKEVAGADIPRLTKLIELAKAQHQRYKERCERQGSLALGCPILVKSQSDINKLEEELAAAQRTAAEFQPLPGGPVAEMSQAARLPAEIIALEKYLQNLRGLREVAKSVIEDEKREAVMAARQAKAEVKAATPSSFNPVMGGGGHANRRLGGVAIGGRIAYAYDPRCGGVTEADVAALTNEITSAERELTEINQTLTPSQRDILQALRNQPKIATQRAEASKARAQAEMPELTGLFPAEAPSAPVNIGPPRYRAPMTLGAPVGLQVTGAPTLQRTSMMSGVPVAPPLFTTQTDKQTMYMQEVGKILAAIPPRIFELDVMSERKSAGNVSNQRWSRTAGDDANRQAIFNQIAVGLTNLVVTDPATNPDDWRTAAGRRQKYAAIINGVLSTRLPILGAAAMIAPEDPIMLSAVPNEPWLAQAQEERLRIAPQLTSLAKQYVAMTTPGITQDVLNSKAVAVAGLADQELRLLIQSTDPASLDTAEKRRNMFTDAIVNAFGNMDAIPAGSDARAQLRNRVLNIVSMAMSSTPNVFMGTGAYGMDPYGVPGMMGVAPSVMYGSAARYLPTMPQIGAVQRSTEPCMFEHQIGKGPGFWKWKCKRTVKPGVKECNLMRVEKDKSMLVPIRCAKEMLKVLKGYDVTKTTTTLPNGQTLTRQFVTPEVAVIGNVRKLGPAGPGIPVRMTAAQEAQVAAMREQQQGMPYGQLLSESGETINFGGGKAAGRQRHGRRSAGNGATAGSQAAGSQSAGAHSAGAIRLPSRSALRKDIEFGADDIQNFEMGSIPGIVKEPDSWAGLHSNKPGAISFLTYDDSYGTTNMRHRNYGYSFSSRQLPYEYMQNQSLLEQLVSLSYKLRSEWPQYHNHLYDPTKDTIATVESYILVTLGRLENDDKFFKRSEMFQGFAPFRNLLNPTLAAYAFRPPQRMWFSPLSARYLDGAVDSEAAAIDNIEKLARAIVSLMGSELNVKETITLDSKDAQVMAIMEDTLMALLARLQFKQGYVMNSYYSGEIPISDFFGVGVESMNMQQTVRELLSIGENGQRRFLSRELARYLELFQLDDMPDKPLQYLSGLRLRQAKEQGLVIPSMSSSASPANVLSSTNVCSTNVSMPWATIPQQVPGPAYQTEYAPARTTIIVPSNGGKASAKTRKPTKQ